MDEFLDEIISDIIDQELNLFDDKCRDAQLKERMALAKTKEERDIVLREAEKLVFELVENTSGTEEENRLALGMNGVMSFHATAKEMIDSMYNELGLGNIKATGLNYKQVLWLNERPLTFYAERV